DRSRAIRHRGAIATRAELEAEWHDALAALEAKGGEGLRILTGNTSSPTFAAQMDAVLARFPAARWHRWEALHRDHSLEGARLAFGRALAPVYRFDAADVVVALDADFLGEGPGHVRYARDFAGRRKPRADAPMNRLYAVETAPTLAGAMADHRAALPPAAILRWLGELAAALRGEGTADLPLVRAAARDLQAHRGRALLVPGESLPPAAHALVHRLNAELGATGSTVAYVEPPTGDVTCADSLRELVTDLGAGRVEALVILGGNPAYDAPADAGFASALGRAARTLHQGLYDDETAALCAWHVPEAHYLEDWSDARAFDGTAGVVQPLIAPLHGALSRHEVMALLAGAPGRPRDLVRAQWQRAMPGPDFEDRWRAALRDGVIPGTAFRPVPASARRVEFAPPPAVPGTWSVRLRADPCVRDGAFANNAWLQELPKPHSKLTWDNAAFMSAESAAKLGVKTGDRVEVASGPGRVEAPVWILPDHADGAVTLALGFGRSRAGRV
ncbi:MAG TPA: molybdopterin dinucleotide binding domain-containing protein, partial [Usitatibacter sp.]|nr:molybdopterin dinucleotide binding domain-containing protein [Usitatibacter sp.]